MQHAVIDLTVSSDDEPFEPAWRVEKRNRAIARFRLRRTVSSPRETSEPGEENDPDTLQAEIKNAPSSHGEPNRLTAVCSSTEHAAADANGNQHELGTITSEQEGSMAKEQVGSTSAGEQQGTGRPEKVRKHTSAEEIVDEAVESWRAEASTANSTKEWTESFDWFGIRRRARLCREMIESAAGESDLEEKGEVPQHVVGDPQKERETPQPTIDDEDKGAVPASSNVEPTAVDIRAIMRQLKAAWVTTTTNGVERKEWRAPVWGARPKEKPNCEPERKKPAKTKLRAKKTTARAPTAAVTRRPHGDPPRRTKFVVKTWPADIIHLKAPFNPNKVRFAVETPFSGVCGCHNPCRHETCPNGILAVFCTTSTCSFEGKCGHGVQELESLRLAMKRGSSEYCVIATEMIDAGVVLGEYLGQWIPGNSIKKSEDSKMKGAEKTALQRGYTYELKRPSESHAREIVYIDATLMGGLTRFMNHSCAASATFQELRSGADHKVLVVTSREVRPGEEVTVNYGSNLWFVCKCGEPSCQHRDFQEI